MVPLRCLHFGAAVAVCRAQPLKKVYAAGGFPRDVQCLRLLLAGIVCNNLTGRSYPHPQNATQAPATDGDGGFTTEDPDAARRTTTRCSTSAAPTWRGLHMAGRAAFQRTLRAARTSSVPARPRSWRPVSPLERCLGDDAAEQIMPCPWWMPQARCRHHHHGECLHASGQVDGVEPAAIAINIRGRSGQPALGGNIIMSREGPGRRLRQCT